MPATPYTEADIAEVSDNPEWTEADFAAGKPFAEAFPELARTIRRRGEQKAPTKVSTTIRLSRDVLDHFRSSGSGWQTKLDAALKEWIASR